MGSLLGAHSSIGEQVIDGKWKILPEKVAFRR
jgi:hypothetical protein